MQAKFGKKPVLLCVAAFAVGALGVYQLSSYSPFGFNMQEVITLNDFAPGVSVDYQIVSDNRILGQGKKVVDETGGVSLPLENNKVNASHKDIAYRLKIKAPEKVSDTEKKHPAETLDLLLNMNNQTGESSMQITGLEEYTPLSVKAGDEEQRLNADWAGRLKTDDLLLPDMDQKGMETIQLALQNFNIGRDADMGDQGLQNAQSLGSVFASVSFHLFGRSSGGNLSTVQRRYGRVIRDMAEEMTTVMAAQTQMIGRFFDARIQLRTQRKIQELQARAHKDYHPSEQMCRIGSFIRSVAHTESKAQINKAALNRMMMDHYLAMENAASSVGVDFYDVTELNHYKKYYCDPRDNDTATSELCASSTTAEEHEQKNKDIDYTRTIETELTLDVDFADLGDTGTPDNDITDDERDVVSLAKNLYFPNIFEVPDPDDWDNIERPIMEARTFASKMNVAHTSFVNIVGMKSSAPKGQATTATTTTPTPAPAVAILGSRSPVTSLPEDTGWSYMKALLREFGISDENGDGSTDDEIERMLGERPSYYAQMEVLTKKIYQHPDFYTNLYDKPANVERIGASLDAISLMHQRDRYESLLRREMLSAVLLETELEKHAEETNTLLLEEMRRSQFPQ